MLLNNVIDLNYKNFNKLICNHYHELTTLHNTQSNTV